MTVNLEQFFGRFVRHWDSEFEDGEVEHNEVDVTFAVQELVREHKATLEANAKLARELTDLRTRKWWDEIELVTDRLTGNMIVVRTHYVLRAETMRLEVSPEEIRLSGALR